MAIKNPNRYLVAGWIVGPSRIRDMRVRIGADTFPAHDLGLYRPDVRVSFFPEEKSFETLFPGFSVPVVFNPVTATEEHAVQLECVFIDGSTFTQEIGTVTLAPWVQTAPTFALPPHIDRDNLLVICMATYNPNSEYFQRQIESIIAQDFRNWICLICDDNSSALAKDSIKSTIKDDPRFFLIENDRNAGFYGNFARCLELVPAHASFVAFADQDDIWYPQKLSASLKAFAAGTMLVYCDMKIVDKDRNVLCPTYWQKRKNYYEAKDIDLLTLANTVTGAASVFRRELLDLALPFPPRYGNVFHDQWLAIMAAGNGGIRYIDEPLYEYVQYNNNIIGHINFGRQSSFAIVRDYIRQAYISQKQYKGFFNIMLLYLKAVPSLALNSYQFKHIHLQHVETLAETALLRSLNAPARRLIKKTRTVTGLLRIHFKVWKNKETLNDLELALCFSEIANTLLRRAAPVLAFIMKLPWRK